MLCFRQPQIQLAEHLRTIRKAQDKKHECNEFIPKASCGRLDPHRLVLQRAFKNTYELMMALNNEYGAGSGKRIINIFTDEQIVVSDAVNDEHINAEIKSQQDKITALDKSIDLMTKEKTTAAASENFQEAMRLKGEIERAKEQKASVDNKLESLKRQVQLMTDAKDKGKMLGCSTAPVHVGAGSGVFDTSGLERSIDQNFQVLSQDMDESFGKMVELGSEQRDYLKNIAMMLEQLPWQMAQFCEAVRAGAMMPVPDRGPLKTDGGGEGSGREETKGTEKVEPPTGGSAAASGESCDALAAAGEGEDDQEQETPEEDEEDDELKKTDLGSKGEQQQNK